jgi:hypothetical protein
MLDKSLATMGKPKLSCHLKMQFLSVVTYVVRMKLEERDCGAFSLAGERACFNLHDCLRVFRLRKLSSGFIARRSTESLQQIH